MNWKKAIRVGLIAFIIMLFLFGFLWDRFIWIFLFLNTNVVVGILIFSPILSFLIGVAWAIETPMEESPISNWVKSLLGVVWFLLFNCGFHFWILMQGEQAGLAFLFTIPLTLLVLPICALGGVLGSNIVTWMVFRFRKTIPSRSIAIIGASAGGILVFSLGLLLVNYLGPILF